MIVNGQGRYVLTDEEWEAIVTAYDAMQTHLSSMPYDFDEDADEETKLAIAQADMLIYGEYGKE